MNAEDQVIELRRKHALTWRGKSNWFWYLGLLEEVAELGLSLLGWHKDTPDLELTEISSIAMNWLDMRQSK